MRKVIGAAGAILMVTIIVAGFLAYFVFSFDQTTRTWSDGLGRQLTESPPLVRWLYRQDEWAGLNWFLADFAIFWGGGAMAVAMIRRGYKRPATCPHCPAA